MIPSPSCPACEGEDWEPIGSVEFSKGAEQSSEFRKLRLRVLFEVWQPGSDSFVASFVMCQSCGFVCYTPRATAAEVAAKYEFLSREEHKCAVSPQLTKLDRERSRDLYRYVSRHSAPGRVLDFGGGKGGLLHSFVEAGFDCGVVDYVPQCVDGVRRLGATLDDLEDGEKFDLILSSHVFEHLAEPVELAQRLARHLTPEGRLAIEVPLEFLGGPPNMREPVTHVNFFSETSLGAALARAGYFILDLRTVACKTEHGNYRYAVRAIAARAPEGKSVPVTLPGSAHAKRLLEANRLERWGRALGQPKMLWGSALKFGRRVPRKLNLHA